MIKEIIQLSKVYIRERGVRDLILVLVYTLVLAVIYNLHINKAGGYNDIRKIAIIAWIVMMAIYTYETAFKNYYNIKTCFYRMLLPVSRDSLYAWEYIRTFIIFGGVTLAILFIVDGVGSLLAVEGIGNNLLYSRGVRSLTSTLFGEVRPLNYLPFCVYLAVLVHSIIFLSCTNMKWIVSVSILAFVVVEHRSISPFLSLEASWDFITVELPRVGRTTQYLLNYIWCAMLPIALYTLSYLRIKD